MRGLGIILPGILGVGVTVALASGYLPKGGPTALRFQIPVSLATRDVLPPLPMENAPSPPPPSQDEVPSVAQPPEPEIGAGPLVTDPLPSALTNQVSLMPTNPIPPLPDSNLDTAAVGNSGTNTLISPQMLLRYFLSNGPGDSREAIIVPPPIFNPARPAVPASSSATYTSPKR